MLRILVSADEQRPVSSRRKCLSEKISQSNCCTAEYPDAGKSYRFGLCGTYGTSQAGRDERRLLKAHHGGQLRAVAEPTHDQVLPVFGKIRRQRPKRVRTAGSRHL